MKQPKGGMCTTCEYSKRDCSHLPFAYMRPIKKHKDGTVIVLCSDFKRKLGEIQ